MRLWRRVWAPAETPSKSIAAAAPAQTPPEAEDDEAPGRRRRSGCAAFGVHSSRATQTGPSNTVRSYIICRQT